jgi:hypothetical protein
MDEAFKVRQSDRAVFSVAPMNQLSGYHVDSADVLYVAVKRLGYIEITSLKDGTKRAVFRCNGGTALELFDMPNGCRWAC